MEPITVAEEISQDESKKLYEESLQCLESLYKHKGNLSISEEEMLYLQRIQHNIMCNVFWYIQAAEAQTDDFPYELLIYRVRIATQALLLLNRRFQDVAVGVVQNDAV